MSYFAGFTHCRPQMPPNPRFSDLFRQTLGDAFRGLGMSLKTAKSPETQIATTLRRPFYRLSRHRSVQIVGTCCTRPWCQGTCVRSEQLATVLSWTVCLSCSPTIHSVWRSRSRGSLRSRRMRGWRPPDSGAAKYWRRERVPRRWPHSPPLCLRCSPGFRSS